MASLDQPLITKTHDGRRLVIAAVDQAARKAGLTPGMALAHAQAMVPALLILPADPQADQRMLARLAGHCLRFSPMTAPCPPDGLWIDTTGCDHLHGGEVALLERIATALRHLGYRCRIAIADTAGCAHALARYGAEEITCVAPGTQRAALADLPAIALRLPIEIWQGLHRLGLERIGQLTTTARAPLARRFGAGLLQRLDQALGHADEAIAYTIPPEIVQARRAFVEPLLTAEALQYAISLLCEDVCEQLAQRGEGARQLNLLFERSDGTRPLIRIGTARPSRDANALARLLREKLDQIDPGFGVEAMQLLAPFTEKRSMVQQSIGLTDTAPDIAPLVDRLVNRFGMRKIYRLQPVESSVPERALQQVSPLAVGASVKIAAARPARMFDPPQPVHVLAALPDYPPTEFRWRGNRHRISVTDGPDRISGEWWRNDAECSSLRDYWQVEDQTGSRFWLFRRGDGVDPATGDGRWFLHGLFA